MSASDIKRNARASSGGLFTRADWPLAIILLVALALRIAYASEIRNAPDFASPNADAAFHDYWARGLVSGNWTPPAGETDPQISSTPFLRPPGYPYFLAASYLVTGSSYMGARVIQFALGLVNVVLAFLVARSLFGRRAGFIAAALMGAAWPLIYFEGEFQDNVLLVTLGLVLVLAVARWHARPSARLALAIGAVAGLSALARPNILACLPILLAWAFWVLRRRGDSRRFVRDAAAIVLGTALAIAPATIRNLVVSGDPVLISCNGAINLYIGNNPKSDPVSPRIPDLREVAGVRGWSWFSYGEIVRGVARLEGREMSYSDVDRYFSKKAMDYIAANPGRSIGLAAQRALLMLGPAEVSNNKVDQLERSNSRVLSFLPGFPIVLTLALVGVAVALFAERGRAVAKESARAAAARGSEQIVFLGLFAAAYLGSYVFFLAAGRFRVPAIPFLILLGAYGADHLWTVARARDAQRVLAWSACLAGFLVLTHITFVRYTPDASWWRFDRGAAYTRRANHAAAAEEYRKALEEKPDFIDALVNLGASLAQSGRVDEGVGFFRRAIELAPQDGDVRMKLGALLNAHGRSAEAAAEFQQGVESDPTSAEGNFNRGIALSSQNRAADAVLAYEAALQLDPEYVEAYVNLGVELARLSRGDEAVAAYRNALRIRPDFAEARNNLGVELARQGKLDEAIAEYQSAMRIDPDYTKPYENLGRAYRLQNRSDEAIAQYRKFLALEPGNANAHADLGAILGRAGKTDEAIREFLEAVTIAPDNFGARHNLALAYEAKGEVEKAIDQVRQVLVKNPGHPQAEALLRSLEEKKRSVR
ncbi:MAG: tetratricopeptide repeat protein [bacterium]